MSALISHLARRTRSAVLFAALAASAAACGSDPVAADDEPEVDRMTLTVGSSTVTVSSNGTVTGGPLVIPVGTSTVTAQFLRQNGSPDPQVTTAEFRLNASSLPAGLTFTPTANTFSGSLTAAASLAGQTVTVRFSLFHTGEQHDDFGPFPVQVRVGQ